MKTLTDPVKAYLEPLLTLRREAIASHQRRMIVVPGDLPWCHKLAEALVDYLADSTTDTPLWIARKSPELPTRLQRIIGSETSLLIFNAHHGFDPNLFGAASGTVTGGGLILLLSPDFENWSNKCDPISSRITVYPHPPESITNHYIARLIRIIEDGSGASPITILRQPPTTPVSKRPASESIPQSARLPSVGTPLPIGTTTDQLRAIDAILHTATGHRHRPLVITADRGRGKSAALGIAAARLIKNGMRRIVVTAPGRSAVVNLFKHAQLELPDINDNHPLLPLEFIAPDRLIAQPIVADLILIDEAAAIAAPLLSQIVENHSRVVFSTTIHGYEGSGQGFALRFLRDLKARCPDYREVQLKSPIRWAEGDPVEAQVNQMLILDAEPVLPEALRSATANHIAQIERIDRAQLANNEPLLRQLFGLLVLAHYRTTPLDLRQLLDGPNLSIYSATINNRLVATALVADEGKLDDEPDGQCTEHLVDEIWLGRRRPQGHLLPQTLIAHLGIREAAPLRYRRIVRIAVHPALQRRSIGKVLMDKIIDDATTEKIDLIGTSYGATPGLIRFWSQSQLTPIFIGSHRNASSGTYSLTQMGALSDRGSSILNLARCRFQNSLIDQLRDPLQLLESNIVTLLLTPLSFELNQHDLNDIDAFIHGNRRYETVITPLIQLLLTHFNKINRLSPPHRQLLILKLIQGRSWAECTVRLEIEGKNTLLHEMRRAISLLLTI